MRATLGIAFEQKNLVFLMPYLNMATHGNHSIEEFNPGFHKTRKFAKSAFISKT
jgi:hypothetical protein